ncbi:MAG: HAD family hydrolase [Streptosporangiaceae bacterium]
MTTSATAAVVACFDLDGVLVDSESAKIAGFLAATVCVLDLDEAAASWVDTFNRRNRGVPRRSKFATIAERFGPAQPEGVVEALLDAYAEELERRLPEAPAMPGAGEFVDSWPGPRALVTSAPHREAVWQLQRLGIRISRIFDGTTTKADALRQVAAEGAPLVFFGDAPADLDAACEAGVAFVAVGGEFGPKLTAADDTVVAQVSSLRDAVGKEDIARAAIAKARPGLAPPWPGTST